MVDQISFHLKTQLNSFQKQLEEFLEHDQKSIPTKSKEPNMIFETSLEKSLLKGLAIGLPDDYINKVIIVFSRLALFYNAGVLLENFDQSWQPQAFFKSAVVEVLRNSSHQIKIPDVSILSVLTTPAQNILKKLDLSHLDIEEKSTALLVKVTPDFAFLLLSHLPEIWLKDHIANTTVELQNCFAD